MLVWAGFACEDARRQKPKERPGAKAPKGGDLRIILRLADRFLRACEAAGIAIAAVAFALMMFVTVIDVVGRYGFNRPLTWSFDLTTQYLMVAGFFLAISAAQASRQHVSIDVIARKMPPRVQAALLVPACVLACILMVVIAWAGWQGFMRAWSRGLVMDGVIAWPRWPTYLLVAFGSALMAFRLATEVLANLLRSLGFDPGLPDPADGHAPTPGAAR